MKACTNCGVEKPYAEFSKNKANKDGHQRWCKVCATQHRKENAEEGRIYQKEYRDNNVERLRDYRLRKLYGVTLDRFTEMLKQQNHKCLICGTGLNTSSPMDHCHATGKVRGILCTHCNTGLGKFRDNPEFLQAAIAYLNEHSTYVERAA